MNRALCLIPSTLTLRLALRGAGTYPNSLPISNAVEACGNCDTSPPPHPSTSLDIKSLRARITPRSAQDASSQLLHSTLSGAGTSKNLSTYPSPAQSKRAEMATQPVPASFDHSQAERRAGCFLPMITQHMGFQGKKMCL